MKSLKFLIINALTLFIGLGLMSGSLSSRNAEAARFEKIPAIQVHQLGNMRGQYLTALYVVGSRPFISTDSSQINISQVKESRTIYISADSMQLPAVQVEKEGFRPSYNMVVFVVSPQANFSWVNADGTAPQGMSLTNNRQRSKTVTINRSDIENFVKGNGEEAVFQMSLN